MAILARGRSSVHSPPVLAGARAAVNEITASGSAVGPPTDPLLVVGDNHLVLDHPIHGSLRPNLG